VQRLGHVVLQRTNYLKTLNWYLDHFGLIVSDFMYYEGQRERGPTMSFVRCDRGATPTDHHTLAMALGPSNRYVHSAYQVCDLDAIAAGGEYLRESGYRRSWGIGRHVQGSQIFDYWRDPDGFLVEHFADGDMFDNTLEPGWAPFTASGLAQWGPPATKDFLGIAPGREPVRELRSMLTAVRDDDNEFDLTRLRGLLKVARSCRSLSFAPPTPGGPVRPTRWPKSTPKRQPLPNCSPIGPRSSAPRRAPKPLR
jgi:hypothetical protein